MIVTLTTRGAPYATRTIDLISRAYVSRAHATTWQQLRPLSEEPPFRSQQLLLLVVLLDGLVEGVLHRAHLRLKRGSLRGTRVAALLGIEIAARNSGVVLRTWGGGMTRNGEDFAHRRPTLFLTGP